MIKKKNKTLASLKQKPKFFQDLERELKEREEECLELKEQLSKAEEQIVNVEAAQDLEKALNESEEECLELKEQLSKAEEQIMDAEVAQETEKRLKNESYSFLLSEGLLDKFLEYRENSLYRTKQQQNIFRLTMDANLGGLWIDT